MSNITVCKVQCLAAAGAIPCRHCRICKSGRPKANVSVGRSTVIGALPLPEVGEPRVEFMDRCQLDGNMLNRYADPLERKQACDALWRQAGEPQQNRRPEGGRGLGGGAGGGGGGGPHTRGGGVPAVNLFPTATAAKAGSPGEGGDGDTLTALKREWQHNPRNEHGVPLQDEFGGDFDSFMAFTVHDQAGHVTISGRAAPHVAPTIRRSSTEPSETVLGRAWRGNQRNVCGVALRDEFGGDFAAYCMYRRAVASGNVTIHTNSPGVVRGVAPGDD